MIYVFQCVTKECEEYKQPVEFNLSIADRNSKQFCSSCYEPLERVFVAPAIKTNDGTK